MSDSFSKNILFFLKNLELNLQTGNEIEVMNPFKDQVTFNTCKKFYTRFYDDKYHRYMILGINPGRFGGGITGIPFTDPVRLEKSCGIQNTFQKNQELSSVFIYEMIDSFGGAEKFYKKFYITAVSPLGFTKHNKNYNYYDDKNLEMEIKDFIINSLEQQLKFGIERKVAFCLGEGKNFKYLSKLNDENNFFEKIVPLPHPRFIMQYKLKSKTEYIQRYLRELGE
jgi:uracil-DNA glycosylase